MMLWTCTALTSMISLTVASCALEDMQDGEAGELDGENIGTTQSTLCTDDGANAIEPFVEDAGFLVATSALPTNYYDHPACSDRYTVEVTGVNAATHGFEVAADWGELLPIQGGSNPERQTLQAVT